MEYRIYGTSFKTWDIIGHFRDLWDLWDLGDVWKNCVVMRQMMCRTDVMGIHGMR